MSTVPLPLFDESPATTPAAGTLVVLRTKTARPLSRRERAVNRLLQKVEALRGGLERERRRLDAALVFHAAHVRPRVELATKLRTQAVRELRPFLNDRRLKQADRRVLQTILTAQLGEILRTKVSPDKDIQELFEFLHGVSYERAVEEALEEDRSAMAAMFEELGLDIDVPDLRPDMTEEELAASAARAAEQMQRKEAERAARPSTRRKTKRALREEARAERFEHIRKISAGALYRRLVKALHPDLERDPARRERKGALMRDVTTAYARNDLHTLLRIDREFNGEASDDIPATDEILDAQIELLKHQTAELDVERAQLRFHPRYEPLRREEQLFGVPTLIDGPEEVQRLDVLIRSIQAALRRMATGRALQEVRELIKEYRTAARARRRHER